ncbi:unnamed protein product [Rangifer tarandus platyrhynchus]|uniref:Uncharacterized protein n=1 Tax=Rangifer tarandus platyrhynchus TaxID=3082113 RepID=A0ABN8YKN5_RANTA|nr:unnamed protein product [Rangifer tarandus platyrhynchus]
MQFHVSTGLNLTIAHSVDTVITLISQAMKPGPREVESPAKVAQLRSSSLSVDFDFLFSACGGGRGGSCEGSCRGTKLGERGRRKELPRIQSQRRGKGMGNLPTPTQVADEGACAPGYLGIRKGRRWGPVSALGAPQLRGEAPGDEHRLTSPGAHLVAGLEVAAVVYQTFLGPLSFAPPLVGGVWAWGAWDRPDQWDAGPQLSGEAVTWRRQALPGLGQLWAVGWLINTTITLVPRDARVLGAGVPEGEPGTGGNPQPQVPVPGLTVPTSFCAGREVLHKQEIRTGAGGEGLGRRRVGMQAQGPEIGRNWGH